MNDCRISQSLLPPGVTREIRGTAAQLRFTNDDLRDAYQALTLTDEEAGDERWVRVSRYLFDNWKAELERERLFTLLITLREIHRQRRDPILTLEELASSIGWSIPTVRRQVVERYLNEHHYSSDGWRAFRLYVDIRKANNWRGPGTEPYQFAVLHGEVLHPKHREDLGEWTRRFSQQRALLFGTEREQGSQVGKQSETLGRKCAPLPVRQGSQAVSQPETLVSPLPPTPPSPEPAMHACEGPEGLPETGVISDRVHACQLLVDLGLPRAVARSLTSTPEKVYWAVKWAIWFPYMRHRVRNPRSFLACRIEEAAAGKEKSQVAPGEYYNQVERDAQRFKRTERTDAVAASRPDPFLARKIASAPVINTAVLPELATLWERLLSSAGEIAAASLQAATAVLLDGDTLVIELPATNGDFLGSRHKKLLTLAQQSRPSLTELRFTTSKRASG